jgi:hypothetical protein
MIKRRKSVRSPKLLAFFARLAFTSPGKNCDKFITPTVRVSCWARIKTVPIAGVVTLMENLKVPANESDLSRFRNFIDE